jgi:hypothetical protein
LRDFAAKAGVRISGSADRKHLYDRRRKTFFRPPRSRVWSSHATRDGAAEAGAMGGRKYRLKQK